MDKKTRIKISIEIMCCLAVAIYFTCAVSKETGLIEEISISKYYTHRHDFETMQ